MRTEPRVLIADDDPVFRTIMRGTLATAGFEVIEAVDGDEAFRQFREQQPDLILLDVIMPRFDGFQVCMAVRGAPGGAQVPVLIMTALDDLASIERAYAVGATDFLEKPPNWAVLPRRLQYVLRASRAMSELLVSREAAVSASRAKSGFLASVSHELRTPIAAILGHLDLLQEEPALSQAGESVRQALAGIDRNGRFLVQLIDDVLESAQIEKGIVSIAQEPVDVRVLTADVVASLQPLADAKGLVLRREVDDSVPALIDSDARRLRQILQHLVGNALKFTPAGEVRVQLCVERSAQGASTLGMVVSDTGIGIPPEEHQRIFEPFAQVDGSRSKKVGGIGLGLSIVERVVQGLSGAVELESREGAGSRFSVRIPLRGDSERGASAPVVASIALARPCRILLAEDSPDNQLLLERFLRGAGAEVVVVNDGQAAVQTLVAERERFDLVLMDMQMPVLDGYVATTMAREAGVATPIIALTAHAAAGERERCLAAGCDDYATKPIRRTELLAVVSDWLTKSAPEGVPRP